MRKEFSELVAAQKEFFLKSPTTHHLNGRGYRANKLADLRDALREYEPELLQALNLDLGKSEYEAYTTELLPIYQELNHIFKNAGTWLKNKKLFPSKLVLHGQAAIQNDPKGCVLIIAPWNYPVNLAIMPLIAAILAGNVCVVKPSEHAPHTAAVLEKMINSTFEREYVCVVNGDAEVAKDLLAEPFDHIFFTGSPAVGKEVMAAAAKNLASVTLELGGKSPCIVTDSANIYKAAKSIAWAKLLNCGQTCVAPDYVLVAEGQKEAFVSSLAFAIRELYGEDPLKSPDYGRIVNRAHFERLKAYIEPYRGGGKLFSGGQSDEENLKIAPTILTDIDINDPVMQEEIFGPIIVVLTYDKAINAIRFVNSRPQPLAAYLFNSTAEVTDMVTYKLRCGGLCINDTMSHMIHPDLPFGGNGASGMGRYHGKAGYLEFSNQRAIFTAMKQANDLRFAPYTDSKLAKLKQTFKLGALSDKNLR